LFWPQQEGRLKGAITVSEEGVRTEEFSISGDEAVAKAKELVQEGNVRRLILKTEEGKTLIEVPLTVGVGVAAGMVLVAPVLAAIGALAAIATDLTLVVEREQE
jgi:hypothetical protein